MTKWLQSGRRRDICILLAERDDCRGQELKSALESHYDERIEPRSFYDSLSALVDSGLVETRTDGLHDVYYLSEGGARRLDEHYEWMREHLE